MKLIFTILLMSLLSIIAHRLNAQTPGQIEADSLKQVAKKLYERKKYYTASELYEKAAIIWPNCKDCKILAKKCRAMIDVDEENQLRQQLEVERTNGSLKIAERKKEEQRLNTLVLEKNKKEASLLDTLDRVKRESAENSLLKKQIMDSLAQMKETSRQEREEKKRVQAYSDSLSDATAEKDRKIMQLMAERHSLNQDKDSMISQKSQVSQQIEITNTEQNRIIDSLKKEIRKRQMKFNYFSLRISYPFVKGRFNNPVASGFAEQFSLTKAMIPQFKVGLELGGVTHFFQIGSPTVRFGANFNFTMQTFGKGTALDSSASHYSRATSDELFMATLSVGPQITFKPFDFLGIAIYGRGGISGLYGNYNNTEYMWNNNHWSMRYDLDVRMRNLRFAKDIGIDVMLKKFSVGIVWSFLTASPGQDQYYTPDDKYVNKLADYTGNLNGGTPKLTPYTQTINYNRVSVLVGLAL